MANYFEMNRDELVAEQEKLKEQYKKFQDMHLKLNMARGKPGPQQYKELLNMDNVELEITDEALHAIARKTIERKTGARGLRSVMESILMPIMYKVPSDATIIRVTIDEDTVDGGEPKLEYGAVRKRYKNLTSLS